MRLKLRAKVRQILGVLTKEKYWVFCGCVESVGEVEFKKYRMMVRQL